MKGAVQQRLEQGAGHVIARNPSLSTIHEERTSQMYETPTTERSATVDERAEVSFSFDGKEVSVSLYETPDLTEEEALQVIEMYADQLSEHVSGECRSDEGGNGEDCIMRSFLTCTLRNIIKDK
jgi:hypothetical protein